MNDLKFAFRQLLKNPGFTGVAVLTLALGVGANTAIFSLIDAVLVKTLPIKEPEQIVVLTHAGGDRSGNGFSYPVFEELRERNHAFSDLFAFSTWPEVTMNMAGREEPLPGGVLLVSGNYHAALGIHPLIGRLISPEDNQVLGGSPVAVISFGFWQRRFGGDRSVVGNTIVLNGTPFTVIGVTPPEFFGVRVGRSDSITIPIKMQPQMMPGVPFLKDPGHWDVELMGRLKPGLAQAATMAGLRVLFQQVEIEMEGANPSPERLRILRDRRIELAPASKGLSELRKQFSEPLRILMAVVGLVLLIACANVANLLLARATTRRKEMALRQALGAGRLRLVRQLLTESALLSLLGGAAGLLFAKWVGNLCVGLIPDRTGTIVLHLALDGRVLAFTAIVSIFTGILFGLAPAWQTTRIRLVSTMQEGAREIGQGPARFGLGRGLVAAQVALSLILLVGAGLFVRTFQTLKTLDPGFVSENLLLFSLDSRMRGYTADQAFNLFKRLVERIARMPGVVSATVSRDGNFGGGGRTKTDLGMEGDAPQPANERWAYDVPSGPRFFETFGMTLVQGRDFTLQDDERAPKVAILNETAARHFFGPANPVGRRIGVGAPGDTLIIGVVRDAKLNTLREEVPRAMYRSFLQTGPPRRMTFAVRTAAPPLTLLTGLRRELEAEDPNLPLFGFTTLKSVLEKSLAQERLFAVLTMVFGLLALVLAAVGLYGVMAYSVSQRTREIGIRMALGARKQAVFALVVSQGMYLVLDGLAAGGIGAFGLSRLIANRLYGIPPHDPWVFGIVSALLASVALLACYLPARRAARVDPMEALRCE